MRSLGGMLRRVGAREVQGPQGHRTEILFSTLAARGRLANRLSRLARRLPLERLPRRAGLYAAGTYLGLCLAYGAALGGHIPAAGAGIVSAIGYAAAQAGLGIQQVHISGHRETRESEVLTALDVGPSSSLVTLDPYHARRRLEEIDWVRSATVKKLFPATLEVELVEREPFALWQIGGIVSLIDRSGATIALLEHRRHARLPMVVGYGANRAAGDLLDLINQHPEIAGRVRAAVRVAERRWNLRLDNGVEVRLPEHEPQAALAELVRLDKERGLLARDIVTVDMRLADRIVVRLTESGLERRKTETAGSGNSGGRGA